MHFFKLTNCIFQGSTVSRAASDKEKAKELPTLKDNDFLDQNIKLKLPGEVRQQLLDMLGSDTEWLSKVESYFFAKIIIVVYIAGTSDGLLSFIGNSRLRTGCC